ncbi:type ISP restriction/modification enzyme, partial [Guyparkeria halopsychrophila]|uniref:type ISP restriction/modification enzyme n=1 Tax=Guyparkeria halopsychrophila TaxID=3139421 RepID=UPI0037C592D0
RLGIVYTPVEVVDFIIHSVNDVLESEFNQTLGSPGVHIIDPFTGTGTFITRLLQSGMIKPEEIAYKYQNEIHANEIVLLAYYIAAINIEAVYHDVSKTEYTPFEGICLTDTFQMYERDDLVSGLLADNSERRKRQKELDLKVIIGNPPYSTGQTRANDNNQNIDYPHLDARIEQTYGARSRATLSKGLYDSYIRAIRWASDRIATGGGVVGFVTGSGFIEKLSMDGMRKSLLDEFTKIYVFNLRGDIRKNMLSKGSAKEGQNIFGSGSMTGIAITLFVKKMNNEAACEIFYRDIGDDLTTKEKLERISLFSEGFKSASADDWQKILPNEHGDWINQRDASFSHFISLGDKSGKSNKIFNNFSLGVSTNRDAWCYNFGRSSVASNISEMIEIYNSQLIQFNEGRLALDRKSREKELKDFLNTHADSVKINWTRGLKQQFARNQDLNFAESCLVRSIYRPFTEQWLYFNRQLNEMVLQMPRIFPEARTDNRVICLSGVGARSGFSALMTKKLPNLHAIDSSQNFPLKLYEKVAEDKFDLFSDNSDSSKNYTVKDGISDEGLYHFESAYPGEQISKEDIFYYVYGILHSEEYRERFLDNLNKELPRIPTVKKKEGFWAFSKAGRELANLHVNYEQIEMHPVGFKISGNRSYEELTDTDFRVDKPWKFSGPAKDKDKSTVKFNNTITITDVPLEAYDYVVNGKPALEWVMERQIVKTDKASGIVNDANDYAVETMGNPAYPLELFRRVITVSLETMRIVRGLPTLDI